MPTMYFSILRVDPARQDTRFHYFVVQVCSVVFYTRITSAHSRSSRSFFVIVKSTVVGFKQESCPEIFYAIFPQARILQSYCDTLAKKFRSVCFWKDMHCRGSGAETENG